MILTSTGLSLHDLQSYMERTRDGWARLASAGQVSVPALILPIAAGIAVAALISIALLGNRRRREKRKLDQELAALVARAEAAEAASAGKTEFLGSVSHEIRTPLNAILGFTQLALKTELPAELHEYLHTVQSSAGCLMQTVDDVLDFSQLEAGALTLENVPFSLPECIVSALKMIEPEARAKKLVTASKIDTALPRVVRGDPARLSRVLFSLLDHAVKFTASGSLIVKAVLETGGADDILIRITVTDTGLGIPASEQPFLFDPFRGKPNRKGHTSALGLAVSSRLVQLMGGSMTLRSQLGAGSTFEFTARLEKGKEAELDAALHASETPAREASARAPERMSGPERSILVVDDDAGSRRLVSKVLQSAGHRVWAAANGQEALHFSQTEAFDLIFMDLEMPDLDGLQVTHEIRKNEAPGLHVPVYALTAHASTAHRESCIAAGMDGFLSKPVAVDELLKVLSELPPATANPNGGQACDQAAISREQDSEAADAPGDHPCAPASMEPDSAADEVERLSKGGHKGSSSSLAEFDLRAIWKNPDDQALELVDDAVLTGTQELCKLAAETSRDPARSEEPKPAAAVGRTLPDLEAAYGDSESTEVAATICAAASREVMRSNAELGRPSMPPDRSIAGRKPADDISDPFVQARRALYKSRFDVRVIHNNGDPTDRNLI